MIDICFKTKNKNLFLALSSPDEEEQAPEGDHHSEDDQPAAVIRDGVHHPEDDAGLVVLLLRDLAVVGRGKPVLVGCPGTHFGKSVSGKEEEE